MQVVFLCLSAKVDELLLCRRVGGKFVFGDLIAGGATGTLRTYRWFRLRRRDLSAVGLQAAISPLIAGQDARLGATARSPPHASNLLLVVKKINPHD
jgi:hypothetical protein